jgi:hypothetical protein
VCWRDQFVTSPINSSRHDCLIETKSRSYGLEDERDATRGRGVEVTNRSGLVGPFGAGDAKAGPPQTSFVAAP